MTSAETKALVSDPYPLANVYGEFLSACADLSDLAATDRRLFANGWTRSLPTASSTIGRVVLFQERHGRSILTSAGGDPSKPYTYRKTVDGRGLDLMLQAAAFDGGFVNGCRMFDFGVDQAPGVVSLTAVRDGKPTVKQEEGLVRLEWPSADDLGPQGLQIVFLSSDHRLAKMSGLRGLNFQLSFIGLDSQ